MQWNTDDVSSFVRCGDYTANVARDGRRWRWWLFDGAGRKLLTARSASEGEARDSAEWHLRRRSN